MTPILKLASRLALSALVAACASTAGLQTARSDWRGQYPSLTFGAVRVENLSTSRSQWDPLAKFLSERLHVPVTFKYASDYAGVVLAFNTGHVHGAYLGAAQYALLQKVSNGAAEPLVAEINVYGSPGAQSIIVVKNESPIHALSDLKGKKIAFPDPNSGTGYIVPSFYLAKMGYMEKGFFAHTNFVGTHEGGILAVVKGQFDAATTFRYSESFGMPDRMAQKGLIPKDAVRTIWNSNFIPTGPFAVRKDLPAELKAELADAFLEMPADITKAAGGSEWASWRKVSDGDYVEIIEIMAENERRRKEAAP
jgi:phosphonate transport system substrate-binding protein